MRIKLYAKKNTILNFNPSTIYIQKKNALKLNE